MLWQTEMGFSGSCNLKPEYGWNFYKFIIKGLTTWKLIYVTVSEKRTICSRLPWWAQLLQLKTFFFFFGFGNRFTYWLVGWFVWEGQKQRAPLCWFTPQMPAIAQPDRGKAESWELNTGFPCGCGDLGAWAITCCFLGSALGVKNWSQVSNPVTWEWDVSISTDV